MKNQIYSVYHLTLDPVNFEAFKTLIAKIVAATSKEPGTLTYEYVVNAEKNAVHIIERYLTAGLLPHVNETFSPFAEEFLSLVTIDRLFVYGETTPEIREILDGFGAIYFTPFDGFTR
jgi:quinol monooxygenase YgiN